MADHDFAGCAARRRFKGDGAYSVARSSDNGFAGCIGLEHVARLNRCARKPVGDVFDLDVERAANGNSIFVGKNDSDDGVARRRENQVAA